MTLILLDELLVTVDWWISGILFLAMGFAFVWLCLEDKNSKGTPWKKKLAAFRWTILPLMAKLVLTATRAFLRSPRENISLQNDLVGWDAGLKLWFFYPLVYCLFFFFVGSLLRKTKSGLLIGFCAAVVELAFCGNFWYSSRDGFLGVEGAVYVTFLICGAIWILALVGFIIGRISGKKKEKKEQRFLEEAV